MSKKRFKASNGIKYMFNRIWAYANKFFCNKGKQKKSNVKYIVIHNTGNKGRDTALANAMYFKNKKGTCAGAHFVKFRSQPTAPSVPLVSILYFHCAIFFYSLQTPQSF